MIDTERRDRTLARVRNEPVIMGILNVTPDSFSDGGRHTTLEAAEAQALRMLAEGAGIIDIGGESTRPGAAQVSAAEELVRVLPIIRHLASRMDAPISIDTVKASVARAAIEAGAVIINDVTGMTGDPEMPAAVAETGAAVVITYHRGTADEAIDAVADMHAFFDRSFETAARVAIAKDRIWLDPGVGFAKTPRQNLEVIAQLDTLARYGCPVLVGLSRKSFIGHVTGRAVDDRLAGTLTAHLMALQRGARVLRVHDVAEHTDLLRLYQAIEGAGHEN
ncbi:dihydropteroate synthase [Hyphomonas neptunium ATCC 15444]|uniref:Dihydropteroate synthase n=2 Tax=Hyphomonas TaxID=85 RepID=Q0BZN2_HYPNA|nr:MULTISPECIES: dihydropteroate synthase [Hyphomonas]ABI75613.1 dihydropteroate synthase [Hyphomonas neptunium ATCC 15444]KCZ86760.1 dihydropteroate synthase [Hyphomonas hirschiana VP5]